MTAAEYEILSPTDKPALVALSTFDWQVAAVTALKDLDYKTHYALNHDDFKQKFIYYHYQVVIIEDLFDSTAIDNNISLKYLQNLPMSMRRHAVIILAGNSFHTLNPLEAFAHSVHAVVNGADMQAISKIIQKVVADNDLFLDIFRDTQMRIRQGKV